MALQGDLWVIRKTYSAAREMRDPKAYLKGPIRVRAPRRDRPSPPLAPSAVLRGSRSRT
jgi:hypothetical protein